MISNNIDKLWLPARLRRLHLEKERAFKSGDRDLYRLAKYTFGRTIKEAKRQDINNLEQFTASDSSSIIYFA